MRKVLRNGLLSLMPVALLMGTFGTMAFAETHDATYPLFEEPITLKGVVVDKDMTYPRSLWTEMGKLCGINFEFTNVGSDQLAVYLAASDWPDFFHFSMSSEYINDYGVVGGMLANYNDGLIDYMPHLQAMMEMFPNARKAVTYSDGAMYQLPYIDVTVTSGDVSNRMHYRTDVLAEYDLAVPTTTEEFYTVAKTITEKTGKPSLVSISKGWFYSAFGPEVNWEFADDGNGKVIYNSTGDQYLHYLQYMNRLYTEGILHQEYLTLDSANVQAICADGCAFMGGNGAGLTAADFPSGKYDISQLAPLTSEYDDTRTLMSKYSQMGSAAGFAISAKCEYKQQLAQCLDILYATEEVAPGTGLYCAAGHYGPEGIHWEFTDDTKTEFRFIFDENPDNESGTAYCNKRDTYNYGPFLYTFKDTVTNEESNNRSRQLGYIQNLNPYVIPSFPSTLTFTEDEQMTLSTYYTDIATYVSQMEAKFITGVSSLDTDWDAYCAQVKDMGIEQVLEAYQSAYERWLAL